MSIWNKVLIGLIAVASLVFFYLAMRTLKTQEHWRNYAHACEYFLEKDAEYSEALTDGGQLLRTLDDNDAVRQLRDFYKKHNYNALNVSGETNWRDFKKAVLEAVSKTGKLDLGLLAACTFKTEETPGIERRRMELAEAARYRSRVWDRCEPVEVDAQSGKASVTLGRTLTEEEQGLKPEEKDKLPTKILHELGFIDATVGPAGPADFRNRDDYALFVFDRLGKFTVVDFDAFRKELVADSGDLLRRIAYAIATNEKSSDADKDLAGKLEAVSAAELPPELKDPAKDLGARLQALPPAELLERLKPAVSVARRIRPPNEKEDKEQFALSKILYLFDKRLDGPDYGGYLGEFVVEAAGTKTRKSREGHDETHIVVQLSPTKKLTDDELTRLSDSYAECAKNARAWVLYDRMPSDVHEAFAGRSDEEKSKLLPAASLQEYVRDGQPATWEDMEKWGVEGMLVDEAGRPLLDEQGNKKAGEKGFYRRPLRDYRALFAWYDNQRVVMRDLLATIGHDLDQLTTTATKAKEDVAVCKQEVARLTAESDRLQAERKLIVAHLDAVQRKIGDFLEGWKAPNGVWQKGLTELLKENLELAKEISRQQFEAARRIDERTRTMAAAGEGR